MEQSETHLGDLSVANLDSGAAWVIGQAIEGAASAVEALGKPKYVSAIVFLRRFAGVLYDLSTELAKTEGIEPKPLAEQERKFEAAKKKLLN